MDQVGWASLRDALQYRVTNQQATETAMLIKLILYLIDQNNPVNSLEIFDK